MRFTKIATVAAMSAALALTAIQPAAAKQKIFPLTSKAAVITVFASVGTIILDAIIVSVTQCRELTAEEAFTAGALPVVGLAVNASRPNASKCGAKVVKVKG